MRILSAASVLFTLGMMSAIADEPTKLYPAVCTPGIHQCTVGHFDVLVFCDDAQGTNIAVVLTRANDYPAPWPGDWSYSENRVWQDSSWSRDVNSYCWSTNGNQLFVSTGSVYGSGLVYVLDLPSKSSRVLSPERLRVEGRGTESIITGCPDKEGYLLWQVEYWNDELAKTVVENVKASVQ